MHWMKLLSQMHTSQLLAKIKCIIFSYHFIIWYILTLKILYEMDLGDMGRSNHFLHPLHSSTQKCSVSSYCGRIMTACQDVISGHKTTLCAFIFFLGGLWICQASTDPLMIATIPALDCSMLCSLWRTPEISAWHTAPKREGLYLRLLLSLLVSFFPIDCHSLSKKINREVLTVLFWLHWSLTHLQLAQRKDFCISPSAHQFLL